MKPHINVSSTSTSRILPSGERRTPWRRSPV